MDYEEKKQARIGRYLDRAETLEAESDALFNAGSQMLNAIPLGQPMLTDHHSYKSDRAYRTRAVGKIDKSMEVREKAEYYRKKAEAAQNNTAIYAGDPAALDKLKEKLEKHEAAQDHMKKANAYYRKHGTMRGFEGISDDKAEQIDQEIKSDYSWAQVPYAPYQLSNNNAEIRRLRKRIESLTRGMQFVGWEFEGGKAVANTELMRLQLLFEEKPDEDKRTVLKQNGFRWAPSEGAWQRQLNNNAIYAAGRIDFIRPLSGERPSQIQAQAIRKTRTESR